MRQHPLNALPDYESKQAAGKHTVCCERSDGVSFDLISFIPKMKGNEIREDRTEAIHAVYYGTETKKHKSSEAIVRLAVPALSTRFAVQKPGIFPISLPVVPFAGLMTELLDSGHAVGEEGDAAGAKAISRLLPKLVFVPPQKKNGLPNFGKATRVLRKPAADFKSTNGYTPPDEIAFFSDFGKELDSGVLDNHDGNPLLLAIAGFGTSQTSKKPFERLGPACHQAYLESELPLALRTLRTKVHAAFVTVAARCDDAIAKLMARIFLRQKIAIEAELAQRLAVLHEKLSGLLVSQSVALSRKTAMDDALALFPSEGVPQPEEGALPRSWRDCVSVLVDGERHARAAFAASGLLALLSGDTGPFSGSDERTAKVAAFESMLCSRDHWVLPYVLVVEDLIDNHDLPDLPDGEVPPMTRSVPASDWPYLLVFSGLPGVLFVPNSRLFQPAEDDLAYARRSVDAQRALAIELAVAGAGFVAGGEDGNGTDNSGGKDSDDADDNTGDSSEDTVAGQSPAAEKPNGDGGGLASAAAGSAAGSGPDPSERDSDSDEEYFRTEGDSEADAGFGRSGGDDEDEFDEDDAATVDGGMTDGGYTNDKDESDSDDDVEDVLAREMARAKKAPAADPAATLGQFFPALLAQLDAQQRRSQNAYILQ
jgi:hypothetical protein